MSDDSGEEATRDAASTDTGTAQSTPDVPDDPLATAASRGENPLGMFADDTPVEKGAEAAPAPKERAVPAQAVPAEPEARANGSTSAPDLSELLRPREPVEPLKPAEPRVFGTSRVAIDLRDSPAQQPRAEPTPPGPAPTEVGPRVEPGSATPAIGGPAAPKGGTPDRPTHAAESELVAQVRAIAAARNGGQEARRPVPSTVPPPDWQLSRTVRPQPAPRGLPKWLIVVAGLVVVSGIAFGAWRLGPGLANRPAAPSSASQEGRLTVESLPTGAQVEIDGVARGATPLLGLRVKPGRHLLRVGGPGGREIDVVVAAGGDVFHHIDLPEMKTRLHIATVPAGAAVSVDGQRRGVAPLDLTDLAAGTHAVTVEAQGTTVRRDVDVRSGMDNSVVISLSGGGPSSGWLTVASSFDVEVYEGTRLVGRSADGQMLLVSGPHDLTLVNTELGYKETSSVNIGAGRTATVRVQPVNGQLSVNAIPWAEVWLDNERIGETPIANYTAPIGRHEIRFVHPQLGEKRQTVVVTAGSPVRVSTTFTK